METILSQSMPDWELIVCDSYSDDGSWEFFQKFKGDPRVRLHQVPRHGVYAGWNECLRRATGRYVYVATSDDTMVPDCLEKLVSPLERFPEVHLGVCDFQEIDETSQPINRHPRDARKFLGDWARAATVRNGKTEFLLHAGFGSTIWVTMTAVVFRRKLLDLTGYFRTDLGSKADEEWALRASLASDVLFVPEKLATWRYHPGQATRLWSARERARTMCRCIESVIRDPQSGIPDAWKKVGRWEEILAQPYRSRYAQTFPLYRWAARQDPLRFVSDAGQALFLAPRWFCRQALCAFAARPDEDFDAAAHVKRLINIFNADWPPRRV